jgi:Rieske Fe-S protein
VDGVDPAEVVALLNTCTHQGLALNLALRDWKKC